MTLDSHDTDVAIVGAGPAGLLLGRLLDRVGIATTIVERRDRVACESRIRAGMLEPATVALLAELEIDARLRREALIHRGFELRFGPDDDRAELRIAVDELTGGQHLTLYGQTELVKDLIAARLEDGLPLHFSTAATTIEGVETDRPTVLTDDGFRRSRIRARLVVACDGYHGVGRRSMPAGILTQYETAMPYSWLGVLADVAPSCEENVYAQHPRGFALHSRRGTRGRFYLQVEPDTPVDSWPAERIWDELERRLALDGWTLRRGPILERAVLRLRAYVGEPMRHGSLVLAGDAAHIVPPTGAKGLNLAAADVATLGPAIVALLRDDDDGPLASYSETCLRRVWRAQAFTRWMTELLHRAPGQDHFQTAVQIARLRELAESETAARAMAEGTVGSRPSASIP